MTVSDDASEDAVIFAADDTPHTATATADEEAAFNAEAYLRAFPGIADAVERGLYSSALDHFLQHGQFESRLSHPAYIAALSGPRFEAHLDSFGYSSVARSWLVCGWTTHTWDAATLSNATLCFDGAHVSGPFLIAYHERPSLKGRGTGFVLCIRANSDIATELQSISLHRDGEELNIPASRSIHRSDNQGISLSVRALLQEQESTGSAREILTLLSGSGFGRLPPEFNVLEGFVDWYGYHPGSSGWFLCGWVNRVWNRAEGPKTASLHFADVTLTGCRIATGFFFREDLQSLGTAFIIFAQGSGDVMGNLSSVEVEGGSKGSFIRVVPASRRFLEPELVGHLRPLLSRISDQEVRGELSLLLSRVTYAGTDTLHTLTDPVLMDFDSIIACPPGGIVIMGWLLTLPGTIRSIRLRSETLSLPFDIEMGVPISRPDVISAVGADKGFSDPRCGFIVFVPGKISSNPRMYIEIETERGEIAYRHLPASKLEGIPAMRRMLEAFDVRFTDVAKAFDLTIGPAIELLNRHRLQIGPQVDHLDFGTVNARPRFSVIVPLYGRLDFVEYQMAFLLENPAMAEYEWIYVLDDPPKRREALYLFNSVYARFGLPFRAVFLSENLGFAPANNVGLSFANGEYVCFLNSDVFPGMTDWLERLAARLEADPALGAVGPTLLYGDETVQHEGMTFKTLREFGNWHFGDHPRKGRRRSPVTGLRRHISITGAAMLLRTELAKRIGGFDESYVIGDFEDSDLCLRLEQIGLYVAVDMDVHLYHLERKSQAGSGWNWRMNLTLFNAWVHERRWGKTIDGHPLRDAGEPVVSREMAQ